MSTGLRLLLLAAALLLQGCFTTASLSPALIPRSGEPTGLVFGSLGVSASAPTIDLISLQFQPAGLAMGRPSEFLYHAPVGAPGALLSPMYRTPTDFREPAGKGTLFVARLPAGDYVLVRAAIANAPFGGWGAHVYEADAGSVPFHVQPGKATYLGQFLAHLHMGRDRYGVPQVAGAYFVTGDQLARDLRLLASRGESVTEQAVINQAPRFSAVNNDVLRSAPR